ncbi:allene oxide synthase-lipoxygenase protein-like isoform X3 [Homarus americanus]|uniref:allene oxide synthase-lipoxygenase protein-like isoform X3 n=1 Tax=Homarus americanus TaxID=6706 RepID=UPI001C453EAB|nr:allene oxide synthase-lipoxygenase protein-like isoform X3 [Homarus americanus]
MIKSPFLKRRDKNHNNEKDDVEIKVVTGDRRGAGTDSKVFIILHDSNGRSSPQLRLNNRMTTNCRGQSCTFNRNSGIPDLTNVSRIEFWIEKFGLGAGWFVDRICVKLLSTEKSWVFPVLKWVKPSKEHIVLTVNDCLLPQHTPMDLRAQRMTDLGFKKAIYRFKQNVPHGPAQIENLPSDEKFSEEYYWTFATDKLNLLAQTKFIEWTTSKWNTLDDLKRVYRQSLGEPTCIGVWKEDWWFGLQRLQGVNPNVIRLCKKIPDNFAVTEETVKGFLGEMSLAEALEKNKMFICDLEITDGLVCKEGNYGLASPLALFHLNSENSLLPVAIQLKQKRGPDNPVYTPNDPPNTWLVAKMFYNNVEAQHHQALTHLGYTHLLMEGVVICTHRNLSPSHPLFKLMAPHFLFLLAINTRGLEKLVAPGGWVDNCMTQGVTGIFNLMKRGFDRWRFDREGQVEKELEARGVLDKTILPYYPYRDDAIPLYNVIKKYVTTVVKHHYDTPEKISGDWELRWWREELVKSRDENGVGLQNVPGTADGFTTVEEVIDVVTVIISICSLGHAAANFQQYEQYGFVPNYPGILMLDIPKEKKNYTEEEIMAMLPDKRMTLDIMVITKLLSSRGTKSLGDFEMQYLYDPVGVQAAEEFQKDLKRLSYEMKGRNIDRPWKFDWLDPEIVPNSISV